MKSKNEIWLKALKEVTDLLETNNCRYILDTGTLLGAIREKGFIEWDNDIDISVIDCQDQESKILNVSKALYDLGYNVTSARDVIDVFDNTGILNLGVKFYDHVNGNYVSTLSKVQGRMFYNSLHNYLGNMVIYKNGYGKYYWKVIISNILKSLRPIVPNAFIHWLQKMSKISIQPIVIPESYLSTISNCNLYGETFRVPEKAEDYLEYRYGKNWRTPKRNYNYIEEDGSLKKN